VTADGNTLFPESQKSPAHNAAPLLPVQSPELTDSSLAQSVQYTGIELWIHRLNVLVFVFLCASMGVLLVIVPWWPQWTDNHFILGHPAVRTIISDGFTRGVCSGLGVLDVWIGFSAAIHYREDKPV
jgi:uncharacterized membrane protein